MDRRKRLKQFVIRAKRSLNIERMLPSIQYGLLIAVGLVMAILFLSRLFVFPYYIDVALYSSIGVLIATIFYLWWYRVKDSEALMYLDTFYPHNELITALSFKDDSHPLIGSILNKAQKESFTSFERFRKRKKVLWKPRALLSLLLMIMVVGVLYIFPSPTQQEAALIEKENEVINELEKEVADLEKKSVNEEVKAQLQDLLHKLKELDSSEKALREVVKKQKELKLQEQELKEKQALENKGDSEAEGLTAEEEERLKELQGIQNELANTASTAQTALGKLGKPLSTDLQSAIAIESDMVNSSQNSGSESQGVSNNPNSSSGQQTNSNSSQGSGNNQGGSNSSQGQGTNGSQGQGNGSGQGSGSGTGQGQGNGSGTGGQGTGNGNGAGFGQGSKDLLAIPDRFNESGETIVDGGPLGDGKPLGEQEGPVPVTKGTIRPYEEVIGQYKDRYMESSERMQLPKDLQDIVQSYFSTLESEE